MLAACVYACLCSYMTYIHLPYLDVCNWHWVLSCSDIFNNLQFPTIYNRLFTFLNVDFGVYCHLIIYWGTFSVHMHACMVFTHRHLLLFSTGHLFLSIQCKTNWFSYILVWTLSIVLQHKPLIFSWWSKLWLKKHMLVLQVQLQTLIVLVL